MLFALASRLYTNGGLNDICFWPHTIITDFLMSFRNHLYIHIYTTPKIYIYIYIYMSGFCIYQHFPYKCQGSSCCFIVQILQFPACMGYGTAAWSYFHTDSNPLSLSRTSFRFYNILSAFGIYLICQSDTPFRSILICLCPIFSSTDRCGGSDRLDCGIEAGLWSKSWPFRL